MQHVDVDKVNFHILELFSSSKLYFDELEKWYEDKKRCYKKKQVRNFTSQCFRVQ